MLTITEESLSQLENTYPGLTETIRQCEAAVLPACVHCRSENTAVVGGGLIGRSVSLAGATSKFKLLPSAPFPGKYYCNTCGNFFDEVLAGVPKIEPPV